jgi:hypothetical protein
VAEPRALAQQLLEARVLLSKYREAAYYGEPAPPLVVACAEGRLAQAERELAELARLAGGQLRVDMNGWAVAVTA